MSVPSYRILEQSPVETVSSSSTASLSTDPDTSVPPLRSSDPQRLWIVLLYSVCTILLFADQNLLSPNLTSIAKEFHFSDQERDRKLGGDIALAFFLLGAPASLLVGCLADQSDRTLLFAGTIFVGEGACLATYWSTTYRQLYLCRAVTGFSVGGALPLIYSLLGDLYSAEERHVVNALVGIGVGGGIALGQAVAGFLGPTFGWRVPFLVISIPALLCALITLLFVKDPERGAMEHAVLVDASREGPLPPVTTGDDQTIEPSLERGSSRCHRRKTPPKQEGPILRSTSNEPQPQQQAEEYFNSMCNQQQPYGSLCGQNWGLHIRTLGALLSTKTVVLALLQGAPGCVPWGIVNTYLNDFLAEDRGMSVERATFTVLCFGLGNFFGMLVGGGGGRYLYQLDCRYPALLAGSTAFLGCFPFWGLLNLVHASSSFLWVTFVAVLAGLSSGVTGPIIKATLQNVTLPTARGQAFALFNTFDDFGRGLGPVFVASLISDLGGRTAAFNIGTLGWAVCGLVNLGVYFTVERDERTVQSIVAANLKKSGTVFHSQAASNRNEGLENHERIGSMA